MADADLGVPPRKPAKTRIDVVLFSGGSGTKSIAEALLRHPQIRLRILINAYDDGHSTGRLRRFIPSMLGPSDVRKNIDRLMPVTERCHQSLKSFSNDRLPVEISRADALQLLDAIVAADLAAMPPRLADLFRQLTVQQAEGIRSMLSTFLAYFHKEEESGGTFDFTHCALGNLLFAGSYLAPSCDFNAAIAAFCQFYEVAPGALLNVTQGENLFLMAWKEDDSLLVGEADIVAAQTPAKIADLYLIGEDVYRTRVEGAAEPAGGWLPLIREAACYPRINPAVVEAIAEADVIVYGPGTQHSSLFPSYLTQGLAEAIAQNHTADKIFIGNILRDLDIQTDDVNDLARKFMRAMTRQGQAAVEWRDCVTQLFVQRTEDDPSGAAQYIPFDPAKFLFPMEGVHIRDWESRSPRDIIRAGSCLDELQQIVQSRIDIELQRIQHMVSIVVPVLNEARTLGGGAEVAPAAGFSTARDHQGNHRGGWRLHRRLARDCAIGADRAGLPFAARRGTGGGDARRHHGGARRHRRVFRGRPGVPDRRALCDGPDPGTVQFSGCLRLARDQGPRLVRRAQGHLRGQAQSLPD